MAIGAEHCPGGVMFLFRGEVDSERAKDARIRLLNVLKNETVDILYLDNAYCNPSYDFPTREVAAQQVVDIIASHPEHDNIIGIDTLGKEELLIHISRVLSLKIWASSESLQTMHRLGFHDTFTTKTSLTRVQAIPRYSFSVENLEGLNTIRPAIGMSETLEGLNFSLASLFPLMLVYEPLWWLVYFGRLCGVNQPPKRFVYKH